MSWTYQQSTGNLTNPNGALAEVGYSGNGIYKNDPASQCVKDHGPIPVGLYAIGPLIPSGGHLGPNVMELTPDPENEMCGRGGFFMHGDSISDPGNASDGCIIMSHNTRLAVAGWGDNQLEVIA